MADPDAYSTLIEHSAPFAVLIETAAVPFRGTDFVRFVTLTASGLGSGSGVGSAAGVSANSPSRQVSVRRQTPAASRTEPLEHAPTTKATAISQGGDRFVPPAAAKVNAFEGVQLKPAVTACRARSLAHECDRDATAASLLTA